MTSGIDGLISGLDTTTIITQLMATESQGKTALQKKVTDQQSVNTAFQSLNTMVANIQNAATDLTKNSTWQAAKATSSFDGVTATASAGTMAGEYAITVQHLATAHIRSAVVADTGDITNGSGIKITSHDGTVHDITVNDTSAKGVASAINAANVGVRASLLTTDEGTLLQLTATKTGEANQFEISGLTAAVNEDANGTDAEVAIAGGHIVKSANNTFTTAIPGVTFTATKEGSATVKVTSDATGLANKVSAMVGLVNSLLTTVKSKTAQPDPNATSDTSATTTGPLAGNFLAQSLGTKMLDTVSSGVVGVGSLASIGIQTTRSGGITFDQAKFLDAYQNDPDKVKTAIATGFAATLNRVSTQAKTDITAVIQNGTENIRSLNTQISNWTDRLKLRQETLQTQFTNLEVALGKLKDQSEWLAGQLSSLSSSSSG